MTPLTLSRPSLLPGLSAAWLRPLLARLLSRLAGRAADLPERLEDWQLRDLNLTRPRRASWPGLNRPLHYDLP